MRRNVRITRYVITRHCTCRWEIIRRPFFKIIRSPHATRSQIYDTGVPHGIAEIFLTKYYIKIEIRGPTQRV